MCIPTLAISTPWSYNIFFFGHYGKEEAMAAIIECHLLPFSFNFFLVSSYRSVISNNFYTNNGGFVFPFWKVS